MLSIKLYGVTKNKTYILVNHLQSAYLQAFSEDEQAAIMRSIGDFIQRARPYVDGVIWAYAEHSVGQVGQFDLNAERLPIFCEGDIVLKNENGRGDDGEFLKAFDDHHINRVILAGTFFDACSTETGCSLSENLQIKVFVPPALSDAPFIDSAPLIEHAISRMRACGVDTSTTTEEILEMLISGQDQKLKTCCKIPLECTP